MASGHVPRMGSHAALVEASSGFQAAFPVNSGGVVPRPPEHVRCKNFGCNKPVPENDERSVSLNAEFAPRYFDPRHADQTAWNAQEACKPVLRKYPVERCVCHRLPPVFHETAKYWACCPDKKAGDTQFIALKLRCLGSVCQGI